MKYLSTRGGDERLSFEETVLTGLAPNGGLYIPASLPQLPKDWQTEWSTLSFQDLALEIYSLFIDPSEIPRQDLAELISRSYSTFRHPDIAPLRQTGEREYVLELWHGPTFAFKDVALQFLGNLFEYFLKRRNEGKKGKERETLTVVGATSGDTGSAAIYGLRNKQDISIFILHPKGRVSPIQEAQMTTVTDANVFNLAVEGTFDDCQDIVKALFADAEFNEAYHLGAINSINWARILAQIVYYFSSYFALLKRLQISPSSSSSLNLQYVVPTGNFGDILAGFYAKRLGLPTERLVIATNSNDILTRFWKTGRYEKADSSVPSGGDQQTEQTAVVNGSADGGQAQAVGGVLATLSPAMDILVSSNFERLLFYLAFEQSSAGAVVDEDKGEVDGGVAARIRKATGVVQGWMSELKTKGRFEVPAHVLEAARREFTAERVSDQETRDTILRYFTTSTSFGSYIVDPHTAVGLDIASRVAKSNSPETIQIVLSTAHPAKFSEAVTTSFASLPPSSLSSFNFEKDVLPPEFIGLLEKDKRVITVASTEKEGTQEVIKREVEKLRGAAAQAIQAEKGASKTASV